MSIITISRGTMSGGKKLAEMLAEKLGYRCVSREIVVKAADDYGVPEGKLFDAVQKAPSIFQKLSFQRERYLAYIQASLCEYARDDNLIYHGNAGHLLLRGISHVLRLRLVGELPFRINAAMEQLGVSDKEALKYIERVDKERVKWTNFLYGKDWRSPELYDIVFNLGNATLDFVCEVTTCAIKQPQFHATAASKQAMRDLHTASRVRAALAGIPKIRLDRLVVTADGSGVVLTGRTKTKEQLDAVLETARATPGVEKIDCKVEVDYRSYGIE